MQEVILWHLIASGQMFLEIGDLSIPLIRWSWVPFSVSVLVSLDRQGFSASFRCSLYWVVSLSLHPSFLYSLCELCQVTRGWWAWVLGNKRVRACCLTCFWKLGWLVTSILSLSALWPILCAVSSFVPYGHQIPTVKLDFFLRISNGWIGWSH